MPLQRREKASGSLQSEKLHSVLHLQLSKAQRHQHGQHKQTHSNSVVVALQVNPEKIVVG